MLMLLILMLLITMLAPGLHPTSGGPPGALAPPPNPLTLPHPRLPPPQVFSIACSCGAAEDVVSCAAAQAFVQQHQQHDARLRQLDPPALERLHRAQQLSGGDRAATAPPGGAGSSLPAELTALVGQCVWSACLVVLMQPPEHPAAQYQAWATALLASGCLNGCTNAYRPWQSKHALPPRLRAAARAAEPPTLLHRWLAAPCHTHFRTSCPQLSAATSLVVKEAGRLLHKGQVEPSPFTVRSRLKRRLEGCGTPCTVEQLLRVGAAAPCRAAAAPAPCRRPARCALRPRPRCTRRAPRASHQSPPPPRSCCAWRTCPSWWR
jgi:hypothetical protein